MNPVQKTGILALGLLLAVAVVGFLLGPNKADPRDERPDVPVIDIAALPAVEFQPPERREFWIAAEDFRQDPVQHPLEGGSGRRITEWEERPEPLPVEGPMASPGGNPAVPAPASYRVRENETLSKIAARELGDAGRWREIAGINGLQEPYTLYIGQLLLLPSEQTGPVSAWSAQPEPAPAQAEAPPAAPQEAGGRVLDPAESGGWTTYTVKKGESISEISQQVYGTMRLWKHILEANGIDDPIKLRAGQTLRIPPRP